jgi:S-DNA-T family DNA segregation ATPase FtsK/SpoIIIE
MLEDRNHKRDLVAILLAALTAFVVLALVTYDPADPPARLVYPARAEAHNLCGRAGALAAGALLEGLGLGAYFLAISGGVLAAVLLCKREVADPWLRAIGWLLALVGLTTLAAMAVPGLSPGPVIGAGGYLGALGRTLLETHLASAGGYLVVISVLLGGLLLSTDYVLVRLSAYLVGVPAKGVGRGLITAHRVYAGRRRADRPSLKRAKSTAAGDDDEDDGLLSVRIRGKSANQDGDEDADDTSMEGGDDSQAAAAEIGAGDRRRGPAGAAEGQAPAPQGRAGRRD